MSDIVNNKFSSISGYTPKSQLNTDDFLRLENYSKSLCRLVIDKVATERAVKEGWHDATILSVYTSTDTYTALLNESQRINKLLK